MASIFDVARYILQKSGKMCVWKLQRLCWYTLAWHDAWTGHTLFNEDFEAWENGPVCPKLFECHQSFGVAEDYLPAGKAAGLNDDERDSIDVVLKHYGGYDAYALKEMVRHEVPYRTSRKKWTGKQRFCGPVIPKENIFKYYRLQLQEISLREGVVSVGT